MGISGIFKEIGPGDRRSLIALSAHHHATHSRPFRLAIDTSIWLFQIQASKGGSNPALRTFYYRLLRLLAHNIHPLFVFDGPNKPTWKRNKKVGGPGVRVASVPEFLAKQLLKEFGFPWHVAPGEAEAECAVLQREGVVDAVMSEDVDTLMFGSGLTLRNWTPENKGKVPTHVNVYRADDTTSKSGLDREGMILVAMMSGGDYIVEGIPGCGPRVACDAARAGFGKDLCAIAKRKDVSGLGQWRERLQRQINTNESKFFTRKNKLVIPDDFPSREVLGYYTDPCVSTPDKIERLGASLQWDQGIDYVALRNFTADAFDWRCISGAKKFVRNLAPALLVRDLRLKGSKPPLSQHENFSDSQRHITLETQEQQEKSLISAIHNKRTHASTDNSLEYRISFTPMDLVPIDLSMEDEDDDALPVGGPDDLLSEADNEWATVPASTQDGEDDHDAPTTKTRGSSLYDPTQPEKLWLMADFLRLGCPVMVRMYEDGGGDPKALFKARREARAKAKGDAGIHAGGKKLAGKGKKKLASDMPVNALMAYTKTVKSLQVTREKEGDVVAVDVEIRSIRPPCSLSPRPTAMRSISPNKSISTTTVRENDGEGAPVRPSRTLKSLSPRTSNIRSNDPKTRTSTTAIAIKKQEKEPTATFRRLESHWLQEDVRLLHPEAPVLSASLESPDDEDDDLTPKPVRKAPANNCKAATTSKSNPKDTFLDPTRPFARFGKNDFARGPDTNHHISPSLTPVRRRLKRPSEDEMSSAKTQRTIDSYFSPPSSKKAPLCDVIDLVSSSPVKDVDVLPPPVASSAQYMELEGGFLRDVQEDDVLELPPSVTKRRPRKQMKRAKTAPVGMDDGDDNVVLNLGSETPELLDFNRKGMEVEAMDLASPSPVRRMDVSDVVPAPATLALSPSPPKPLPRRSPRVSSLSYPSSSSSRLSAKDKGRVKPPKKQRIQLRESLEGAWKFVDVDTLDLTEDIAGGIKVHGVGKMASWRRSGVELLDLTEE